MRLIAIPVQSVTDLITNSSSEVFILNTDKSCEQVNEILDRITQGFNYPEIFHLDEYRKWRARVDNGEIEEDFSYPGSIFQIAKDWFIDPENKEDMYQFRKECLFFPWKTYGSGNFLPVHQAFIEYINNNWQSCKEYLKNAEYPLDKSGYFKNLYDIQYKLPDKFIREFIDNYKEPVYGWNLEPRDNVESLDGKLLVVSSNENSIPYYTWDTIYENFEGFNIHLG